MKSPIQTKKVFPLPLSSALTTTSRTAKKSLLRRWLWALPTIFCILLAQFGCAEQGEGSKFAATSSSQKGFTAQDFPKVAVVVRISVKDQPYGEINKEGLSSLIENIIQASLLEKGYEVADRSSVDTVLKEINFQGDSGFTKEQQAQFGDAIGCQGIYEITVNNLRKETKHSQSGQSGSYSHDYYHAAISAKLLDLKKCSTVWTSNVRYPQARSSTALFSLSFGPRVDSFTNVTELCASVIAESIPNR